jgi:hypothetical protein
MKVRGITVSRGNHSPTLKTENRLMLAILDGRNESPGVGGEFILKNLGGEPAIGTLYIDANPGELNTPINFIYEQTENATLLRGEPPSATYQAYFEPIRVPTPQTFNAIIKKLNEGQYLQLGPNEKGVCVVPKGRRAIVLGFLGFEVE